jgi:hypothetical protein
VINLAKKLKLYVWEDVLEDYTSGMAVALAPDVETALKLLSKKAGYDLNLPISKMKEITTAEAF